MRIYWLGVAAVSVACLGGCGEDDSGTSPSTGGNAGEPVSGGSGGESVTGGSGGESATGGNAGEPATGGNAGEPATGGNAGDLATGGNAGEPAAGGDAGSGGSAAGTAGEPATGGNAGEPAAGGDAGSGGSAGGTAGAGGGPHTGGTAGGGGVAGGMAGSAGTAGGGGSGPDCATLEQQTPLIEARAAAAALRAEFQSLTDCSASGACVEFQATSGVCYGVSSDAATSTLDALDTDFSTKYGALSYAEMECFPAAVMACGQTFNCIDGSCTPF